MKADVGNDSRVVAAGEWAGGWRTLAAACCGVGTTWVFFQITSGLFIIPMQADFGWSRKELSIGPIGGLLVAIFLPIAGMVIDRYGARRVAICGLIGLSCGFLMLAEVPARRFVFYTVVVYVSVVGSISNSVVFARGLASWFHRRFGTALGIMMTGISVTTAIGIPLLSKIIASWGWRAGFLLLAGIVGLIGLPVTLLWFRARPPQDASRGQPFAAPGSIAGVLRERSFWHLVLATAIAAVPIGGYVSHLQPLLIAEGISGASAAAYGSLFVVAIGIGRLAVGALFDRAHPPIVAATTLGLSALGALIMAYPVVLESTLLLIGVSIAFIGLAQGAESDYLSFFSLRIFGVENFARVAAILAMVASAGMAVGGFAFAAMFDHFGDYHLAVKASSAMYIAAGILFGLIDIKPVYSGASLASGT